MASFTKDIDPWLAKRPLKTNGRLANRGLTSLVKEATDIMKYHVPRGGFVLFIVSQYLIFRLWTSKNKCLFPIHYAMNNGAGSIRVPSPQCSLLWYTCVRIYVCMCVCLCVCVNVCTFMWLYTYTYSLSYMYVYIHIYWNIYAPWNFRITPPYPF